MDHTDACRKTVTLPGQSSTKARILHHLPTIRYSWLDGTVSTEAPVSVEIHLTNVCNLRCRFCSYGVVRANEMLDQLALDQLVDDLIDCAPTLKAVVFSGGGEPSLHPGLAPAIHRLRDVGVEIGVITNGVQVGDELRAAYLRCAWVRVSLDTPDSDHYRAIISPHSDRNFDRVLTNLARLDHDRRADPDCRLIIGVGYVIDRHLQTDDALLACLEVAARVGADYVAYRPLMGDFGLRLTRPLDELAMLQVRIGARAAELGIGQQFDKFIGTFSKATAGRPLARDARCPIVTDGLVACVAATGDVLPCYAHIMNSRSTSFGNIRQQRFAEIWRGPLRQRTVRSIDASRTCPFCRYHAANAMLWNQADQRVGAGLQDTPGYERQSRLPDMGFTKDQNDPHWMFL